MPTIVKCKHKCRHTSFLISWLDSQVLKDLDVDKNASTLQKKVSPNDLHIFLIKLKYGQRKLKNYLKMAFKNSVKKIDKMVGPFKETSRADRSLS